MSNEFEERKCKNCLYFAEQPSLFNREKKEWYYIISKQERGYCILAESNGLGIDGTTWTIGSKLHGACDHENYAAELEVHEEFGCVLWERWDGCNTYPLKGKS